MYHEYIENDAERAKFFANRVKTIRTKAETFATCTGEEVLIVAIDENGGCHHWGTSSFEKFMEDRRVQELIYKHITETPKPQMVLNDTRVEAEHLRALLRQKMTQRQRPDPVSYEAGKKPPEWPESVSFTEPTELSHEQLLKVLKAMHHKEQENAATVPPRPGPPRPPTSQPEKRAAPDMLAGPPPKRIMGGHDAYATQLLKGLQKSNLNTSASAAVLETSRLLQQMQQHRPHGPLNTGPLRPPVGGVPLLGAQGGPSAFPLGAGPRPGVPFPPGHLASMYNSMLFNSNRPPQQNQQNQFAAQLANAYAQAAAALQRRSPNPVQPTSDAAAAGVSVSSAPSSGTETGALPVPPGIVTVVSDPEEDEGTDGIVKLEKKERPEKKETGNATESDGGEYI